MGDLFDSSLDLEECQIAEGRRQGVRWGAPSKPRPARKFRALPS